MELIDRIIAADKNGNVSTAAMSVKDIEAAIKVAEGLRFASEIVTDKIDCPIDETSVIWVGADPTESHFTHTVLKVAKTLNSITYVVKEIDVR